MRIILIVAFSFFAQSAAAKILSCDVATICSETEPCTANHLSLQFEAGSHLGVERRGTKEPPEHKRIWVETHPDGFNATALATPDGTLRGFWTILPSGNQHVMSVARNGVAQYMINAASTNTTHYYTGRCEAKT